MLPGYGNSSALSPKHYKLVKSIEEASSDESILTIITDHLTDVRSSWKRILPPPAKLQHELLLILYCHHQLNLINSREEQSPERELLHLDWALLSAVQLAGRGVDATTEQRSTGYRFCEAVFRPTSASAPHHPLKLLLVNSIRSDLYAASHSSRAEARWVLGLKAAASPSIACVELVPAVSERILEFLTIGNNVSASIRRLALSATLNLLSISPNDRLLHQLRDIVLGLLGSLNSGAPTDAKGKQRAFSSSSTSSTSSISRRPKRIRIEGNPQVLLALIQSTRKSQILHELIKRESIIDVCVRLLERIIHREEGDQEWDLKKYEFQGVKCAWLMRGTLMRLGEEMEDEKGLSQEVNRVIGKTIGGIIRALSGKEGIGKALLLDITRIIALLPSESLPSGDLDLLLSAISSSLHSTSHNSHIFALRSLASLPTSYWSTLSDIQSGWGEKAWSRIMSYLEDTDSEVRKSAMKVLLCVDKNLVEMHRKRLLAFIKDAGEEVQGRRIALERSLEVVNALDRQGDAWAKGILEIARVGEQNLVVLDQVVVSTIERFSYAADENVRTAFAVSIYGSADWTRSTTIALIFAAVAQALPESRMRTILEGMIDFLSSGDAKLVIEMQEPFVLSLLRLSAFVDATSDLRPSVELASKRASFATSPLFDLLILALGSAANERTAAIVTRNSTSTETTLPTWISKFHRNLARQAATSPNHNQLSSSVSHNPVSIEETGVQKDRYSSSTPDGPLVSSRALERERLDILREREERGGKGGVGESILFDRNDEDSLVDQMGWMGLGKTVEPGNKNVGQGPGAKDGDEVDPFSV